MVELADTRDLKSLGGDFIRVQVPSPALPDSIMSYQYSVAKNFQRCFTGVRSPVADVSLSFQIWFIRLNGM